MKRIILIIVLFSTALHFTNANDFIVKPILDSAFIAYKNGNYQKCIDYYKQIEKHGLSSAYMYYNMGNAYFRLKQIDNAILYYERALLLNPSDVDILHNLQYANTFVSDKINELPDPFYVSWFKSITNLFSTNTWAWIALISFILILVLTYLNFLTSSSWVSKSIKTTAFAFVFIFVISIAAAYATYHIQSAHNKAIISSEAVEVKSSPDENGTLLFVIHEGTKVTITDEFEEWAEIRLLDGNTGWVKQNNFERI